MPFEHSNKRIAAEVGLLLGGLAVLVLIGWVALAGLVELGARSVPQAAERALGDALASVVRRSGQPCAAREVEALARAMAAQAGMDPERLEVAVLDDPTVNAFALPGGHVFVLTGLLKKAISPDEVAGVLAHELGHVVLRHHVRAAIRQLGLGAALSAVLGDANGVTALLVAGSSELLDLAFGREQEEVADEFAVDLAARAGFDAAAMGKLLERMEEPGAPPSLLRTHPSGPDRRRRLERLAAERPAAENRLLAGLALSMEALSGACAAPAQPAPSSPPGGQ